MSDTIMICDAVDVTPNTEGDEWDEIIELLVEIIDALVPPPLETLRTEFVAESGIFSVTADGQPKLLGPQQKEAIHAKHNAILAICGIEEPELDSSIDHVL
jgi:hypothetical protein